MSQLVPGQTDALPTIIATWPSHTARSPGNSAIGATANPHLDRRPARRLSSWAPVCVVVPQLAQPLREYGEEDQHGGQVRDPPGRAGKYRFRLKAANGGIIATSEAYETKVQRQERHRLSSKECTRRIGYRPDWVGGPDGLCEPTFASCVAASGRAKSAVLTHHEPFMIHCLAASVCPAGKCLISADTKCDANRSATSARWESVTTPILFMRL